MASASANSPGALQLGGQVGERDPISLRDLDRVAIQRLGVLPTADLAHGQDAAGNHRGSHGPQGEDCPVPPVFRQSGRARNHGQQQADGGNVKVTIREGLPADLDQANRRHQGSRTRTSPRPDRAWPARTPRHRAVTTAKNNPAPATIPQPMPGMHVEGAQVHRPRHLAGIARVGNDTLPSRADTLNAAPRGHQTRFPVAPRKSPPSWPPPEPEKGYSPAPAVKPESAAHVARASNPATAAQTAV